jgi:CRISPR-associated endonuclease/helicase Cas3
MSAGDPQRYYAHSGAKGDYSDWQELKDHLREVATLARRFAEAVRPGDAVLSGAAHTAGLLHDLGKYQAAWQQYLKDSVAGQPTVSVPHAIHGAAHAAYVLGHQALCLVVRGHHAGLDDLYKAGNDLESRYSLLAPLVESLVAVARAEYLGYSHSAPNPPLDENDKASCRRYEFWTRLLFSLLVDADRLDTEKFCTKRERPRRELSDRDPGPSAGRLLDLLEAERQRRAEGKTGSLADLRNQVFKACVDAGASQPQGFFELTVPTGGGKTFSGMAFALAHARRHGLRRVIVVVPFLSIIEQNAREYRQVFGPDVIVEHHSAVAEDGPVPENRAVRSPAELATENWDAPIIVTTSVQFLETLLSASPRRCRKLHNIARSVVLFDEAQAMPAHILNPLLSAFRELKANYGVSFVFSTATQPAFRRGGEFTEGLRDDERMSILSRELTDRLFRELRRVNYHVDLKEPWSWDVLVKRLIEAPQGLCVLNTRAHARTVWDLLREQVRTTHGEEAIARVIHLSSAMCAQHRLDVLGPKDSYLPGSVRDCLKRQSPCWLISTQAIEAGVDIDFPRVFRALGPLDSVVQAAGRCNREGLLRDPATGELRMGEVFVFQPEESGMPHGFYQAAAGEARTILGEIAGERLATDPTVFTEYFSTLYGRISTDAAPKGERPIQEMRAELMFRSVAERAKVIQDGGTPVIVPYGRARRMIRAIRNRGYYDRRSLRRLQRFVVNLRSNDLRKLEALGWITPLLPGRKDDGPLVLAVEAYDKRFGVVIAGLAAEDFIF